MFNVPLYNYIEAIIIIFNLALIVVVIVASINWIKKFSPKGLYSEKIVIFMEMMYNLIDFEVCQYFKRTSVEQITVENLDDIIMEIMHRVKSHIIEDNLKEIENTLIAQTQEGCIGYNETLYSIIQQKIVERLN